MQNKSQKYLTLIKQLSTWETGQNVITSLKAVKTVKINSIIKLKHTYNKLCHYYGFLNNLT